MPFICSFVYDQKQYQSNLKTKWQSIHYSSKKVKSNVLIINYCTSAFGEKYTFYFLLFYALILKHCVQYLIYNFLKRLIFTNPYFGGSNLQKKPD
jgi:hypothetical protein